MVWQIEIRHEGLNKFRVVKGRDKSETEQKVKAQMLAWNEQFIRKLEVQRARAEREYVQTTKENAKREAERRSERAAEALQSSRSILRHTLSVDDRIEWNSLKSNNAFPTTKPHAPFEPVYPPVPNHIKPVREFLDWLIPGRWQNKLNIAWNAYDLRQANWSKDIERMRDIYHSELAQYEYDIRLWKEAKSEYERVQLENNSAIDMQCAKYQQGDADAVSEYCELVISRSEYPDFIEKDVQVEYDSIQKTVIVDFLLPNPDSIPKIKEVKYLARVDGVEEKFLKPKEIDDLYEGIIFQIALRVTHEMFEADVVNALDAVVFNGFVNYTDRARGNEVRACIVALHAGKQEFNKINLSAVDPKQCFRALKGLSAPQLAQLTPVAPIMQIKRDDPRFIPNESISNFFHDGINIATIGWEEFEHLIREIFESEFSTPGSEVRVTRASRDAGVDAVIFDPDPIRGGKIVVQAKRYINTVEVSAVRDLYGTVMNEGALKGILVTTSSFGPDSYSFAKGKPISLIDGQNLLYLFEKHGKKARIDLKEARELGNSLQRRTL